MTFEEMRREMKAEEEEVKDKMFTKHRMSQLKRVLMKNRDCMVMSQFFVNTKRRNRYALFEFAMRKSVFEEKEKKEQQ